MIKKLAKISPTRWLSAFLLVPALSLGLATTVQAASGQPTTKPQTLSGKMQVVHTDNPGNKGGAETDHASFQADNGHTYQLKANAQSLKQFSGKRVTTTGVVTGNNLALLSVNPLAATAAPATSGPNPSPTSLKLAILMVNFSDDVRTPVTAATLRSGFFTGTDSAQKLYTEASYGKFSFKSVTRADGDVYGYYTINWPSANQCDPTAWGPLADAAAQAAGVNLAAYTQIAYVFAAKNICGWGGASDYGSHSWYAAGTITNWPLVAAHEIGHNMGLEHASDYRCTDATGVRVSLSATCVQYYAYGDPYNPMGYSPRNYHFDGYQKERLGWLSASRVKTVTTTGTYLLQPLETNLGTKAGLQVLKFQRDNGTFFYVEWRQPIGLDKLVGSPAVTMNGVKITLVDNPAVNPSPNTHLIDGTPGSNPQGNTNFDDYDAVFAVGKTLTDPVSGDSIKIVGKNSAGAMQVKVTLGPDIIAPNAPTNLQVTATTASSVSLAWNAVTDNIATQGYSVYRDGVQIGTTTTALTYTDSTATNVNTTRYVYTVKAYDAVGNLSAASNTAGVGDFTPPAAPVNPFFTSYPSYSNPSAPMQMAWTASPDPDVAGYRIYRNGVLVGTSATTLFTDTTFTLVLGTVYSYYITAVDQVGNESAHSTSFSYQML